MGDEESLPAVPRRYRKRAQQQQQQQLHHSHGAFSHPNGSRERLTLQTDALSVGTGGSSASEPATVSVRVQLPTQVVTVDVPMAMRADELAAQLRSEHRYELTGDDTILWEIVSTSAVGPKSGDRKILIRRPLRASEALGVVAATWAADVHGDYDFYLRAGDASKRLDTNSLAFLNARRDFIKSPPVLSNVAAGWARGMRTRPASAALSLSSSGTLTLKSPRGDEQTLAVSEIDIYEAIPAPAPRCIALRAQQSPSTLANPEDSFHLVTVDRETDFDTIRNAVFTARSHVLDHLTRSFVAALGDAAATSATHTATTTATDSCSPSSMGPRSQGSSPLIRSIPSRDQMIFNENGLIAKSMQQRRTAGSSGSGSHKNSPVSPHNTQPFLPQSLLASTQAVPVHDKHRTGGMVDMIHGHYPVQVSHGRK